MQSPTGHLTFGVELKNYQSNDCKFDHFTLEYLGDPNGNTGINELSSRTAHPSPLIHDLTDRRVSSPTKGLYIMNGHKVMIK